MKDHYQGEGEKDHYLEEEVNKIQPIIEVSLQSILT